MPDTEDSKSRVTLEQNAKTKATETISEFKKASEDTTTANTERSQATEIIGKRARITNDAVLTQLANRKLELFLEKHPIAEISALNPNIKEPILLEALGEIFKDATDQELYERPPMVLSNINLKDQLEPLRPGFPGGSLSDLGKPYRDDLEAKRPGFDVGRLQRAYVELSLLNNIMELNWKMKITAQSYPSTYSQEVSWFSDNPAVATVRDDNFYSVYIPGIGELPIILPPGTYAGKGFLETHSVGTATIGAQNIATGAVAACTISVQIYPKSITITPSSFYFWSMDQTCQLTATVLPTNATDKSVTWISTCPEVYSVSDTGLVRLLDKTAAYSVYIPIIARTNRGGVGAISEMIYGPYIN